MEEDGTCFQDWFRARLRMVGEEIIRRSEVLSLDGLDAMVSADISIHIPTIHDSMDDFWPSMTFSFSLGEVKLADALTCGEFNIFPPRQNKIKED